jgi:hypothetical protein
VKIIYTPEGASKREWSINPENVAWDIRYGTEKATDWPWLEFVEKLQKGSAIAMQALIWVLRKRDEPRLQLDAVKPEAFEVDIELEDGDLDEDDEQAAESAGGAHAAAPEATTDPEA